MNESGKKKVTKRFTCVIERASVLQLNKAQQIMPQSIIAS